MGSIRLAWQYPPGCKSQPLALRQHRNRQTGSFSDYAKLGISAIIRSRKLCRVCSSGGGAPGCPPLPTLHNFRDFPETSAGRQSALIARALGFGWADGGKRMFLYGQIGFNITVGGDWTLLETTENYGVSETRQ